MLAGLFVHESDNGRLWLWYYQLRNSKAVLRTTPIRIFVSDMWRWIRNAASNQTIRYVDTTGADMIIRSDQIYYFFIIWIIASFLTVVILPVRLQKRHSTIITMISQLTILMIYRCNIKRMRISRKLFQTVLVFGAHFTHAVEFTMNVALNHAHTLNWKNTANEKQTKSLGTIDARTTP